MKKILTLVLAGVAIAVASTGVAEAKLPTDEPFGGKRWGYQNYTRCDGVTSKDGQTWTLPWTITNRLKPTRAYPYGKIVDVRVQVLVENLSCGKARKMLRGWISNYPKHFPAYYPAARAGYLDSTCTRWGWYWTGGGAAYWPVDVGMLLRHPQGQARSVVFFPRSRAAKTPNVKGYVYPRGLPASCGTVINPDGGS